MDWVYSPLQVEPHYVDAELVGGYRVNKRGGAGIEDCKFKIVSKVSF